MDVWQVLFAIAGVVFLILAGANVRSLRFSPEWYGLACLAAAFFLVPLLNRL